MMINKRLIGTVAESKKYIAGNVILQWCSLTANIALMLSISRMLAELFRGSASVQLFTVTGIVVILALAVRFFCSIGAAKMGYFSSKAVKKSLREKIYQKLLRLGSSYNEQVKTSEVVQVAVEGVDQLETYFGAYLPQFFYAMLAPLTLFIVLCFVNVAAAVVLLICVPLIPVAIAAVQTWAKKLLSKYWGQYTELGDTFLENLQGLTTLKIYQADAFKQQEMNEQAEKFRKITMKVLTMQLNSITIMDLIAYGGAALGVIMAVTQYPVSYTHLDVYKRQDSGSSTAQYSGRDGSGRSLCRVALRGQWDHAGGGAGSFSGYRLQNFPEGAIISMPLKAEGFSKSRSFLYGTLSGAVEPIGALLTILLAGILVPVLPYALSFAAGAMIYVVVEELIPEMSAGKHSNVGTILFAVGFTLMMVLDVALG